MPSIWNQFSLRGRVYAMLSALMGITVMGAMVLVWYTYRIENLMTQINNEYLPSFQSAELLESALINQKGFVSYYFLDNDPDWLRQLGEYRQIFKSQLIQARALTQDANQTRILDEIGRQYSQYVTNKDRVIEWYKAGQRRLGAQLHQQVRQHFFSILKLCDENKALQLAAIARAQQESHRNAIRLRIIAVVAICIDFALGLLLALTFVNQILIPVRSLANEANRGQNDSVRGNEISALLKSVHGLMADAGQTHIELARSRENLLQAEKMAMVGKLAAGMAHSIRNPLTSVKMRLFSLNRSLDLNKYQVDDFNVISDEIRHIDTIVQNFLEFSRPPKLRMQTVNPSDVIDAAIQLLKHRLKSYDVRVTVQRGGALPDIQADAEQLKEVIVNIVINACEAMKTGGMILIAETEIKTGDGGKSAQITITDTGPGLADNVLKKIFQPFFTTREEGTGLGLSIARRIVEEHGGRLDAESVEGRGAAFILTMPILRAYP